MNFGPMHVLHRPNTPMQTLLHCVISKQCSVTLATCWHVLFLICSLKQVYRLIISEQLKVHSKVQVQNILSALYYV